MAAFANGLALGADGLELDVHLSRDGEVVVHHDSRLDRTTDATGPVAQRTAAELAHVDAGYRFARDGAHLFRGQGHGVPRLADVLARFDVPIIIELKVDTAVMAAAAIEVVRRAGADRRVCFGSFGGRVLREVRRLAPDLATSASRDEVRLALYRTWARWPVSRVAYQGYQIPEHAGTTRVVSARFVGYARRAGLGVQVWTVDAPDTAVRLISWGVDALISDRPDLVVPAAAAATPAGE